MKGGDVAKTDDGFPDGSDTVDDPLQSVSAARTKDEIYIVVRQRGIEIRSPLLIRSGKTSPLRACVRALAHFISPRAQA